MNTKLDLTSLRDAITSLDDGIEVVSDPVWFDQQNAKVQNTLISGAVKNFEFVYEISVKMIRRVIELESSSPNEVEDGNFRELLRNAGEKGLVADVEAWFTYRKMRNITAHTYDHEKAQGVYHNALKFVNDARALLPVLERRVG